MRMAALTSAQQRYREIAIFKAAGFKLHFQVKSATSLRCLTFSQGESRDSTSIRVEESCLPEDEVPGLFMIGKFIYSGEATHATPQDLSTLLRWS